MCLKSGTQDPSFLPWVHHWIEKLSMEHVHIFLWKFIVKTTKVLLPIFN